jgi:hypothetical protein
LRDIFPVPGLPPNPILNGAAVDVFGHQILAAFEIAHIVYRKDVRVIERRSHLRFALKSLSGGRIRKVFRQELDRDRPAQLGIESPEHHSHSPSPDLGLDFVLTELRARSHRFGLRLPRGPIQQFRPRRLLQHRLHFASQIGGSLREQGHTELSFEIEGAQV